MKYLITSILTLFSFKLFAQKYNGVVTDKFTNRPIQNVNLQTASFSTITSIEGKFSLSNIRTGDTIKFTCIGYKPYHIIFNKISSDTIHIYLEQDHILLKNVTINGVNGYKTDSINKRKEFAAIFAYKSPGFKNVFITKSPYTYTPYSYNTALNSSASIVNVNLLSVIGLLNKNNAPVSRLQKTLLKDEEDSYIDHVFSKPRVKRITSLKGDSLSVFMDKYRPSTKELKIMTDYELTLYIKKSYQEYIKTNKHDNH